MQANYATRLSSSKAEILEVSPARSIGAKRVLVADDDPATRNLLTAFAARDGYQVVSVTDGREAYRVLKSDSNFCAAVFNMMMPDLDGVGIVRFMKTEKRLVHIPVIVVTGEHGLRLAADSFAAGATAFLPKPFTKELLQRTLRMAMNSREGPKSSQVRAN